MSSLSTPVPVQVNLDWFLHSTWLLLVELIGATGQMLPFEVDDVQMRIASDAAVLLDLKIGDGVSIPDATAAFALVSIPVERQAGFAVGNYRYEIRSLTTDGVFALQYGVLRVGPSLFDEFTDPGADDGGGQLDFSNPANSGLISTL